MFVTWKSLLKEPLYWQYMESHFKRNFQIFSSRFLTILPCIYSKYMPTMSQIKSYMVYNKFSSYLGDKQHVWCFKEEVCRGGWWWLPWWEHVLQPIIDVPTSVRKRCKLNKLIFSPFSTEIVLSMWNVCEEGLHLALSCKWLFPVEEYFNFSKFIHVDFSHILASVVCFFFSS